MACPGGSVQWHTVQLFLIAVFTISITFARTLSGVQLVSVYLALFLGLIPHVYIQLKLGNQLQLSVLSLLAKYFPFAKGVGVTVLLSTYLCCIYLTPYANRFGMFAAIAALGAPYAWSGCENSWNTEQCLSIFRHETGVINSKFNGSVMGDNISQVSGSNEIFYSGFNKTDGELGKDNRRHDRHKQRNPAEEFYKNEFLQQSDGIDDTNGFPIWTFGTTAISGLPFGLFFTCTLLFLTIGFGGRLCGIILSLMGFLVMLALLALIGHGYKNFDRDATYRFKEYVYHVGDLDISGDNEMVTRHWLAGMTSVVQHTHVWTGVWLTIGKLTGDTKMVANTSWVPFIVTFAVLLNLPQLAKIPYLGNLALKDGLSESEVYSGTVFTHMTWAFSELEVPPGVAFLFYLSGFLVGLMTVAIFMYTIVDNIVDVIYNAKPGLKSHNFLLHLVLSAVIVIVTFFLGIVHTEKRGVYFSTLVEVSTSHLMFLQVGFLTLAVIFVYVRQVRFNIAGRIVVSLWCLVSGLSFGVLLLFTLISYYKPMSYGSYQYPQTWQNISWLIAIVPFLPIPFGVLHTMLAASGNLSERCNYGFLGCKEIIQEEDAYVPMVTRQVQVDSGSKSSEQRDDTV